MARPKPPPHRALLNQAHKPFDATAKAWLQADPKAALTALLTLQGPEAGEVRYGSVELLDMTELHLRRDIDAVVQLVPTAPGAARIYYHIEFERRAQTDLAERILLYQAILRKRLATRGEEGAPPALFRSIAVLLGPPAAPVTGALRWTDGGGTSLTFTFGVVALYDQPVEALVADPTTCVFTPLGRGFSQAPEVWLRSARDTLQRDETSLTPALMALLSVLANSQGLDASFIEAILNTMHLIDVPIVKALVDRYARISHQEGLEEGLEQGLEKGLEQGLEKGLEQGLEKGLEQGLEKGLEKGREEAQRNLLARQLAKKYPDETAPLAALLPLCTPEDIDWLVDQMVEPIPLTRLRSALKRRMAGRR